jgi:hypothetical protein
MSAPLDFLRLFAGQLRGAGIRFAITSGMACVHYGLQQTTKDSDWIIAPDDLGRFRELLSFLEQEQPPWGISYRAIFGAPLEADYMAHGWTSHLLVTDADGVEHKVDLFGKAPRVRRVANDLENPDYATRDVVAQMKRTDRPKDWPIVDSLGWQLLGDARNQALVHLQDAAKLLSAWGQTEGPTREEAAARRPLLRLMEHETDPDRLDGFLRLERLVWECVNAERYELYTRAWKDFYRAWQKEAGFAWPVNEPFAKQHERLSAAARRLGLVPDPIGQVGREALLQTALARAAIKAQSTLGTLALVQPPLAELLP